LTVPQIRYLTHPQVKIDPAVPVPKWGLSEIGAQRARLLAASTWPGGVTRIVASGETKALETAAILAAAVGIDVESREAMHENDRSATGFLPPPEFEAVADQFFARPEESVRGWERAIDAQARIVHETEALLGDGAPGNAGDLLLVGHGGVGTLLMLHLLGEPIRRIRDQPPGGGNAFVYDRTERRMVHVWRSIEELCQA
jgi:broad specificity phosphatase PhoE